MFAIGDQTWAGLSKLVEECGEVLQIAGKLMGTRGNNDHWDGSNLGERMMEEISDLSAAIEFFVHQNFTQGDKDVMRSRSGVKLKIFDEWQANGDPSPILRGLAEKLKQSSEMIERKFGVTPIMEGTDQEPNYASERVHADDIIASWAKSAGRPLPDPIMVPVTPELKDFEIMPRGWTREGYFGDGDNYYKHTASGHLIKCRTAVEAIARLAQLYPTGEPK